MTAAEGEPSTSTHSQLLPQHPPTHGAYAPPVPAVAWMRTGSPLHDRHAEPAAARPPPPLAGPPDALGDRGGARRHDHERPADLRGLCALREPRRAVPAESARRHTVSPLETAGRLARRGAELALRPDVAPRRGRPPLSRLPREKRRV